MDKEKGFIRRNKFFVLLLSVLLLIILSLTIYILTQKLVEKNNTPIDVPTQEEPTQEDAMITEFLGTYNRMDDQIHFHWSYSAGKTEIESVHLYHSKDNPIDVSSYSSWTLPRDSYGLTTGDNDFTLIITQANGKEIKKTINVFVKYVVRFDQQVKQEEGRTRVTLTYQYQKEHPVKVPKLIMLDDTINYNRMDYIDTKYKEENGMIIAKTTYEFQWYEYPVEYQQFSILWAFEDINDSVDFTLEKGNATQANPNEN